MAKKVGRKPQRGPKFCKKCGEIKPLKAFYIYKRWDNIRLKFYNRRESYCKNCQLGKKYEHKLRKRYDLPLSVVSEYKEKYGSVCQICNLEVTKICVDHCHITGRFRGMLCVACNLALGLFKDSPVSLKKAAEYLEAGGERT